MKTIIFIGLVISMVLASFSFKEEKVSCTISAPKYERCCTDKCDLDEFKKHFNSSSKLVNQVLNDLHNVNSDNQELREEHDIIMRNYKLLMEVDSSENKIDYLTDK